WHAEALRVSDLTEQNLCARALVAESLDERRDAVFKDVVAEHDTDRLVIGKVFGQRQGCGNAAFAFLIGIMNAGQAELGAVWQELEKVSGAVAAGDDENVVNACLDQ